MMHPADEYACVLAAVAAVLAKKGLSHPPLNLATPVESLSLDSLDVAEILLYVELRRRRPVALRRTIVIRTLGDLACAIA